MAILLGIPFAVYQVVDLRRNRNLNAIHKMFEEIHRPEDYAARDLVLHQRAGHPDEMDKDDYYRFLRMADLFQRLGLMSRRRYIPRAFVLELYSGMILTMWTHLEPFVMKMRHDRQIENYSVEFERLALDAKRYRHAHYPNQVLVFASGVQTSAPIAASGHDARISRAQRIRGGWRWLVGRR